MKNYLLIIFALLIVGCGNQPNTEEWPIKPTNEIAEQYLVTHPRRRMKSLNYWKAMISMQRLCNRCEILRI